MYNETYRNNHIYGSKYKPVIFDKLIRGKCDGQVVDIIVANHEFFKNLRCGYENDFRHFYAVFAFCAEFGDTRPVFIKDGRCGKLIPLRTAFGGFNVHMDQIQPIANSRRLVRLANCYDCGNSHVNILSKIYPRHEECFMDCKKDKCDCDNFPYDGCGDGQFPYDGCGCGGDGTYDGVYDGVYDGYDGYDGNCGCESFNPCALDGTVQGLQTANYPTCYKGVDHMQNPIGMRA